MKEILLVDDERVLREGMKAVLTGEGYAVRTARDGDEALKRIAERRPDLVLLDVMMPKMNGFRCCEEIRRADALLPVLFLTARDTEADQVRGLGLGADSYLSKDAGEALLLASVRRALDRAEKMDEATALASGGVVRIGGVKADLKTLSVVEDGREIALLTRTEADLLRILDRRRGEFVSKDDLIGRLWGAGYACEDGMLYSHVSNVRKKLGSASERLFGKRHVGYCLLA